MTPTTRAKHGGTRPAGEHRSLVKFLRGPRHPLNAPGWVLLPLRAFLGFTFTFAGLQKLANRSFFDSSNPASIQAQILAAERASPIHPLLSLAYHHAVIVGVIIALAELAVGLGALLGLWTRIAAAGGMLISLSLFLSVSFHANPFYTGSDIVFIFAWIPLLLAGAGDVLSLDGWSERRARRQVGLAPAPVVPIDFATVRQICGSFHEGRCRARQGAPCAPGPCPVLAARPEPKPDVHGELSRRTFLARSGAATGVAAAGLAGAGVVAAAGRLAGHDSGVAAATPKLRPPPTSTATTSPGANPPTSSTPATTPAPKPVGTAVGAASQVAVGGAAQFTDPATGDPAYAVQPKSGKFVAFDALCPHAGCTVAVSGNQFVCPCHGSQFRLGTGAVLNGPATSGLTEIRITEGPDGQLYV